MILGGVLWLVVSASLADDVVVAMECLGSLMYCSLTPLHMLLPDITPNPITHVPLSDSQVSPTKERLRCRKEITFGDQRPS